MKVNADTLRDILQKRIQRIKSENERKRTNAAFNGSRRGANTQSYSEEKGLYNGLRYAEDSRQITVPSWLEEDAKKYVEKKKKQSDPEWDEYQRLKEKFEG
mgnify:CR=1 FL=1